MLILLEAFRPAFTVKPRDAIIPFSNLTKLKECKNPLAKKSRFKFTGKVDFMSQLREHHSEKEIEELTYVNGQLFKSVSNGYTNLQTADKNEDHKCESLDSQECKIN